jgi:hypothetical protein
MSEEQLRQLIRDAIARHTGSGSPRMQPEPALAQFHPSHGMFRVSAGADSDGPCIIEPAVMCNHCGYCKSYGH